ncbi:F-box/kelch-repeat protein SKIP25 [Linum perenne]
MALPPRLSFISSFPLSLCPPLFLLRRRQKLHPLLLLQSTLLHLGLSPSSAAAPPSPPPPPPPPCLHLPSPPNLVLLRLGPTPSPRRHHRQSLPRPLPSLGLWPELPLLVLRPTALHSSPMVRHGDLQRHRLRRQQNWISVLPDVAKSVEKWNLVKSESYSSTPNDWKWEKVKGMKDDRFCREVIDAVGWKGELCMVNIKGNSEPTVSRGPPWLADGFNPNSSGKRRDDDDEEGERREKRKRRSASAGASQPTTTATSRRGEGDGGCGGGEEEEEEEGGKRWRKGLDFGLVIGWLGFRLVKWSVLG